MDLETKQFKKNKKNQLFKIIYATEIKNII